MYSYRLLAALTGAALLPLQQAYGHAVAGPRIFVNTDLIDDPGVSDEANLPLISLTSPDGKSWVTDANFEWDKTILPNLGFGIGTDYNIISHDGDHDNATHGGFGDLYVQLKYNWITIPEHEFMSSVQVSQAFGRAGTTGIDSGFDTTTVSGFFGKGPRQAQISFLIGNEAAERCYLGCGFSFAEDKTSEEFQAATGVPGIRRLCRSL